MRKNSLSSSILTSCLLCCFGLLSGCGENAEDSARKAELLEAFTKVRIIPNYHLAGKYFSGAVIIAESADDLIQNHKSISEKEFLSGLSKTLHREKFVADGQYYLAIYAGIPTGRGASKADLPVSEQIFFHAELVDADGDKRIKWEESPLFVNSEALTAHHLTLGTVLKFRVKRSFTEREHKLNIYITDKAHGTVASLHIPIKSSEEAAPTS